MCQHLSSPKQTLNPRVQKASKLVMALLQQPGCRGEGGVRSGEPTRRGRRAGSALWPLTQASIV